jgi:hypothetical protein
VDVVDEIFSSVASKCDCLDNCETIKYNLKINKYFFKQRYFLATSYETSFYAPFIRYRAFNFTDYLASIGGLVGLIAGVSVISLIEVFYHILLYLISRRPSNKVFVKIHRETDQIIAETILNQEHVLYQCSKYLYEFMKQSSIHGLNYMTDKDQKLVGRFFWMIVVSASALACGYLVADTLSHAELNPTAFQIDEKIWRAEDV